MLYVDANIFLLAVLYEDETAKKAKKLLIDIAEGNRPACTSVLTWDEIVCTIKRISGKEKATEEGKKFLEFPKLGIISVDLMILNGAQRLMDRYGINPRDAIHAASALSKGIREIVSEDENFDKIKEIRRSSIKKL